ncbi:cobyrinate a,c-diamide synthase [Desulfovibrio oxyclinae]|uniref:cobyrinate a,c-diamide synthase n=1 Tax=Desulfovibrio oxyclinae TaxID=63560 RepID=UPI0003760067|nr:cobyrinate a,c-diamide synthase [Desulfovibrio oxyclinae]
MCRGFVIAGTHSGCGKSSVSLGLMKALARKGRAVQPFKCGPDFIDPGHHARACGRPSVTLDGWMQDPSIIPEIFARRAVDASVAVVEGVMGLYDGASGSDEVGSTAQLAKILNLPVVLVADVRSMARSAAALVSGYVNFDPGVNVVGVVLNRVGSANHEDLLREAMDTAGIPVLGCLDRDEDIAVPSRHLGLRTAEEEDEGVYDRLADWVERGIDVDGLLERMPERSFAPVEDVEPPAPSVRIGVARDEAFCFYYAENLRMLRLAGAELVNFSPLHDKRLPPDLDALYIGGGYPELYGFELGQNSRMRKDVRAFSEKGGAIYAECGGFMYLMNDLVTERGRFAMCGVFPVRAAMNDRRKALGYREITALKDCPLGPPGTVARGHEFHYSSIETAFLPDSMPAIYATVDRKGNAAGCEGFLINNTLGSYVHLHFASNPDLAEHLVAAARG